MRFQRFPAIRPTDSLARYQGTSLLSSPKMRTGQSPLAYIACHQSRYASKALQARACPAAKAGLEVPLLLGTEPVGGSENDDGDRSAVLTPQSDTPLQRERNPPQAVGQRRN
jgi:hypothetical protein